MTKQYLGELESRPLALGAPMRYRHDDGRPMIEGQVLEIEPERKLVHSFRDAPNPDDPVSRVTWEITQLGDACKLTVLHEHPDANAGGVKDTQRGWPIVLSGLKTLVETGVELDITWPKEAAAAAS